MLARGVALRAGLRKVDLVRALEGIPPHPDPRPDLEQYTTPAPIAAELLMAAHADGAVEGKRVLDLGCGTGRLAIGAALLGARLATGVDVDAQCIGMAQQAAAQAGVVARTRFVAAELSSWRPEPGTCDTVVMNPPFGAQAANRRGDRLFYAQAKAAVAPRGTVWTFAQENSERFLGAFAREMGAAIDKVGSWDYPLEATMAHHTEEQRTKRVGAYRLAWV